MKKETAHEHKSKAKPKTKAERKEGSVNMKFSKDMYYNDQNHPLYFAGEIYEVEKPMIARWLKRGGVIVEDEATAEAEEQTKAEDLIPAANVSAPEAANSAPAPTDQDDKTATTDDATKEHVEGSEEKDKDGGKSETKGHAKHAAHDKHEKGHGHHAKNATKAHGHGHKHK